tara:strand:+ start:421 stop:588 length:168 start_codon:yes stop_codon:yes gene_type:complete
MSGQQEQDTAPKNNEFTKKEVRLIQWEEWALSMEEHFHASEMHASDPNGKPMGHR